MFSKLWTVKLSDWQRALIIAVITGPLSIIWDSLQAWDGSFHFDWRGILRAAILGFIAYFGKNFFTGVNGKLFTNAQPPPPPVEQLK